MNPLSSFTRPSPNDKPLSVSGHRHAANAHRTASPTRHALNPPSRGRVSPIIARVPQTFRYCQQCPSTVLTLNPPYFPSTHGSIGNNLWKPEKAGEKFRTAGSPCRVTDRGTPGIRKCLPSHGHQQGERRNAPEQHGGVF